MQEGVKTGGVYYLPSGIIESYNFIINGKAFMTNRLLILI